MRRACLFITVVVSVFAMTSCNKGDKYCYPIQTEENGDWGLMTSDGKVLFENEFDEIEYVAVNGYFKVKNKDGLWEIYTADKKPKQVGGEYKYVSPFCNGIALATEKDKPITLINTKGETVKTLDELSGKTVVCASSFFNGLSIFVTDEELYGVINTKGDVILEPKYIRIILGKSIMAAISKKDKGKDFSDFIIFDYKGKEISTINGRKEKIDYIKLCYDDQLIVRINHDDGNKYGIMNKKGEWIMKPHKKAEEIKDIRGDNLIFYNGDKYGVMNTDGKIVIRAKYENLWFYKKDVLIARNYKDGEGEEKLIDLENNQIGSDTYMNLYGLDDDHLAAEVDDDSWIVIDSKGKVVSDKKQDIYNINFSLGYDWVRTDYVDINKLVAALKITKDGVDDIKLSDDAKTIAKQVAEKNDDNSDLDPEDYKYRDGLYYEKTIGMAEPTIRFSFNDYIGEAITETSYETYYGYVFPRTRVVGYRFKNATPISYTITFTDTGILSGKTRKIYEALCKEAKRFGSVSERSNSNTTLISVDGGHSILVAIDDDGEVIFRNILCNAGDVYYSDLNEEGIYEDTVVVDTAEVAW